MKRLLGVKSTKEWVSWWKYFSPNNIINCAYLSKGRDEVGKQGKDRRKEKNWKERRRLTFKRQITTSVGENMEKSEFSCTAVGNVK